MFIKRAFNKVGELVTGSEETKKTEEDQKKEHKAKPESKQETTTFDDLISGKESKNTLTGRETARTAVPVKREI